jgi:hypothetical protein
VVAVVEVEVEVEVEVDVVVVVVVVVDVEVVDTDGDDIVDWLARSLLVVCPSSNWKLLLLLLFAFGSMVA